VSEFFRIEVKNYGRGMTSREAYRAALKAHDPYTRKTVDYSGRGDLVASKIIYPPDFDQQFDSAVDFWQAAEAREKRKDARIAKEFLVSLPRTMAIPQMIGAVELFIHQQFTSRNLVATYALHNPSAIDGENNPHAHILVAMRPVNAGSTSSDENAEIFARRKNRDFDQPSRIHAVRSAWFHTLEPFLPKRKRQLEADEREAEQRKIARELIVLEQLLANGNVSIPALRRASSVSEESRKFSGGNSKMGRLARTNDYGGRS